MQGVTWGIIFTIAMLGLSGDAHLLASRTSGRGIYTDDNPADGPNSRHPWSALITENALFCRRR